ncbi:hypothetical protein T484DRAFT_1843264 [Baffinella frigidus]|nr:hypothetical protein T484DRAFT_1843264 [Cryptophyta sp. CCMP2293]
MRPVGAVILLAVVLLPGTSALHDPAASSARTPLARARLASHDTRAAHARGRPELHGSDAGARRLEGEAARGCTWGKASMQHPCTTNTITSIPAMPDVVTPCSGRGRSLERRDGVEHVRGGGLYSSSTYSDMDTPMRAERPDRS